MADTKIDIITPDGLTHSAFNVPVPAKGDHVQIHSGVVADSADHVVTDVTYHFEGIGQLLLARATVLVD